MKEKWKPKELYKFWNARYFRGKLPDIPVRWSASSYKGRDRYILGSTWLDSSTKLPVKITLNPLYKHAFVVWASTLMHEMVHVEQWDVPEKQAHGRKFQKRIKQLVARGAYKGML